MSHPGTSHRGMPHTQFAERAARRLEAVADRLEEDGGWAKLDTVSSRVRELRVAAHLVRDEALAVTQEEDSREPPPGAPHPRPRELVGASWTQCPRVAENWGWPRTWCATKRWQ